MARRFTGPIAYLTGEYPRATDTFIQREVVALRALGLDVRTCSIRRTGAGHLVGPEQRAEAATTFHVLEAARNPLHLLGAHLRALIAAPGRYGRALGLALRVAPPGLRGLVYHLIYFAEAGVLAEYLRREGVAHIHNHIATAACTVTMLTAEMTGIPYSFTIHGPGIFFEPMHWRIDEKVARARFVACISDFCRAQVMQFAARAHWDKLHVVHCGVEPARYAQRQAGSSGQRLLFVGRLAAVKGVPVLFAALAQLRPAFPALHLLLIGDGPERPTIEADARALGLTDLVTFAGYQSQGAVAAALGASDILVLPSFAEGVPVVLMEAMAAGLPVVATPVGGISELVGPESGVLVPPADAEALAAALRSLLADADLRAGMGRAGRARVIVDFDSQTEAGRLARLFEAYAIGAPRPGTRPEVWR